MTGIPVTATVLAHAASAFAFLILVLLLVAGWRRGRLGVWLIAATAITFAWLALAAYNLQMAAGLDRAVSALEILRSAAWTGFLLRYLFVNWPKSWSTGVRRGAYALLMAGLLAVGGAIYADLAVPGAVSRYYLIRMIVGGNLCFAVAGLFLTENLFRNSDRAQRWRVKFLCFALGGMFGFDFIIYAEAMLFQRINLGLYSARGLALALVVPLIAVAAVRIKDWTVDVSVSRQVVVHSTTLIGTGGYLLIISGAGYYVRQFGGDWGAVAQAAFLFAAVLLLAVVLASGSVRGQLSVFVSKHFFSYKYDYRAEWLRVIRTMSSPGLGENLSERVLCALADIMDSPDGELWLRHEGGEFAPESAWNRRPSGVAQTLSPRLIGFLESREWIVDLTEADTLPAEFKDVEFPEWFRAHKRSWLVIPLISGDHLIAVVVLGEARARRTMNWEDFDLLRTVGRQAASYLESENSARKLAEAKQFDEFNRRFAFVVHDIKNLVSQLSLMLSNAGRFGDNPEFQNDMLETVRGSVEKMNGMLARLHETGNRDLPRKPVDLVAFVDRLVRTNSRGDGRNLIFMPGVRPGAYSPVHIVTDADKLATVINHLIDNGLDATSAGGAVAVRVASVDDEATVEIADNGPGMSKEFIETELFRPFRSTKSAGYGIGAYESRQTVRDLGGRLEVDSTPGTGSVFKIILPAAPPEDNSESAAE